MNVLLFLRWVFSNSGAMRGVTPEAAYVFARGGHPLEQKKCRVCKREYYAFTKSNYYCGSWRCFRRLHEVK